MEKKPWKENMKIEINLDKKYFFIFLAIGLILIGVVGVVAYSISGTGGDPATFGHSVNEVDWSQTIQGNITINGSFVGDGSKLTGIASGDTMPSGMIAMFDSSCPSGWTRFTALDGKFPYGGSSYGSTGGALNHAHGSGSYVGPNHRHSTPNHMHYLTRSFWKSTNTWGYSTSVGIYGSDYLGYLLQTIGSGPKLRWENIYKMYGYTQTSGGGNSGYSGTGSVSGTSASASSLPPYLTVIWCKKN